MGCPGGASLANCCDAIDDCLRRLFATLRSGGGDRLDDEAGVGVLTCVDDEREDDGSIGDRLDEEDGVFSNAYVLDLVLADTDDGSTVR